MSVINSYGVFVQAGVPYLHQTSYGTGMDCLGQNVESPFKLELPAHLKRYGTPHEIDLHPPVVSDSLPDDFINNSLVDLYLPKPNIGTPPAIVYIKNAKMDPFPILRRLAELCSLGSLATVVYEPGLEDQYRNQLRLTNLGPLTLVGVSVSASMPIHGVIEHARISQRNLVITGHPDIPIAGALDYTDAYNALLPVLALIPKTVNLRALGAHFFLSWMALYHQQNQPAPETPVNE